MSMETYYKNYLSHHGIRGQKWGKKNGPPYPLGPGDHSASERKAGWRKSLDKDSNTDDKKPGTIAKKVVLGAAFIAGTALITYGGYKMYQDGKLDPIIEQFKKNGQKAIGDIFGQDVVIRESGHEKLAKDLKAKFNPEFELTSDTVKSTIENVNPTKSQDNCGACVTSSLLNDCGFSTTAVEHIPKELTNGGNGLDPNKVKDIWKGVGEFNHLEDIEGSRKTIVSKIMSKLDESTEPGGGGRIFVMNNKRQYRDVLDNYNKLSSQQRDSLSNKEKQGIQNAREIISGKKNPPGHYFEYFKDANGKLGFKDGQPNGGIYHYDTDKIIAQWFGSGRDLSTVQWTNDIISGVKNGNIQPDPEMIKALLASF